MLELRLLGDLAVIRDGVTLALPASKKTRALLAYLAVTARPQKREKLCDLLWDGPDDPRAALRWSLTKLRPLVDGPVPRLVADRESVELIASDASIDLATIRAAVPGGIVAGVARASTDALRAVAPLVRADLLEGLELPGCYRFDDWLRAEREAARRLHVAILGELVERLRSSEHEQALLHARAWIALAPLDEPAHAATIQIFVELDRDADAMAHYTSCARMFERELGRGPSREIERLRMTIGRGCAPTPPVIVAAPPSPVPNLAPEVPPLVVSAPTMVPLQSTTIEGPPLVGRVMELRALDELFASPRARVGLVVGDPGIGKTRLLDELAAITPAAVVRGRGVEAELVRPYGAWLDALGPDPFRASADRSQLFESVTAWLVARASDRGLVVIIDDVQWIDEASAALLHYVARAPTATRVRFACGARPGELVDNPAALRLIRGLIREGVVQQIGLSPLDPPDTAALAAAYAPNVDAARVFAESGGHPLFAVEIARALARGETSWTTLEELLSERLDLLDGAAREVVPWAAALGGAFSADLLASVSGVPLVDLARAVADLERRALLRATGAELDFVHDLVRAAAYRSASEPRRRLMHQQIARCLAALPDPDGERSVEVAHHADLGGDSALCATASLAAAARCLRLFAPQEAAALTERGLSHVARLAGSDRARLHVDLLIAASHADIRRSRWPALAAELRRAISDAQAMGEHAAAGRGSSELSRHAYEKGDFVSAASASFDAAEHVRTADPESQARTLAYSAQCLALIGREMREAEALAAEAAALLVGSPAEVPHLSMALALIRHHQNDSTAALTLFDRTIALSDRDGVHWVAALCRARAALIELERGRPREALAYCELLQANAARIGESGIVAFAAVIAAAAHLALHPDGELASAIDVALALLRATDAPALMASALACVAELELSLGLLAAARRHATEGITAATRAELATERLFAHATLANIAMIEGRTDEARDEIAAVHSHDTESLDARGRARLVIATR